MRREHGVLVVSAVIVRLAAWGGWVLVDSLIPSSRMCFILPDGFTGVFRIREDRTAPPPGRRPDGTYVFEIPPSGSLLSRAVSPFRRIGSISGEYASGQKLAAASVLETVPSGSPAVRLHILHTDSDGWYYWYIGTDREAVEARARTPLEFQQFFKGGTTDQILRGRGRPSPAVGSR